MPKTDENNDENTDLNEGSEDTLTKETPIQTINNDDSERETYVQLKTKSIGKIVGALGLLGIGLVGMNYTLNRFFGPKAPQPVVAQAQSPETKPATIDAKLSEFDFHARKPADRRDTNFEVTYDKSKLTREQALRLFQAKYDNAIAILLAKHSRSIDPVEDSYLILDQLDKVDGIDGIIRIGEYTINIDENDNARVVRESIFGAKNPAETYTDDFSNALSELKANVEELRKADKTAKGYATKVAEVQAELAAVKKQYGELNCIAAESVELNEKILSQLEAIVNSLPGKQ